MFNRYYQKGVKTLVHPMCEYMQKFAGEKLNARGDRLMRLDICPPFISWGGGY